MCVFLKITSTLLPTNIAYVFQITGTALFFSISIILFLKGVSLCNCVTSFLGKISLEIYLTQGMVIMLFECIGLYKTNIFLYGALVIIATVFLAACVHPIFGKINAGVRKEHTRKAA